MPDTPDLTSYLLVHEAMRRGAARLAAAIAELAPGDRRRARALRWWYRGFAGELQAHHRIEDDLLFPALAARVPTFAEHEAAMVDDHARLDEVLVALGRAIHGLARGGSGWARHHPTALARSGELARILHEHLHAEDTDVLPLFCRHFSGAEFKALDDEAIRRIGPRQLLFTVPWAIMAAEPDLARRVLAEAPGMVSLIWRVSRRRHARRASLALGVVVSAVA